MFMICRVDNCKTERTSAGVTQDELAQKANTSLALIQRLEVGGACTNDEVDRIAAALNVSTTTLGKADL